MDNSEQAVRGAVQNHEAVSDNVDLGEGLSDKEAVRIVAEAYERSSPHAERLRDALRGRLDARHRQRLTKIANRMLRSLGKTDDPDMIASDAIEKFCCQVVPQRIKPIEKVSAYLSTMTSRACVDCPSPTHSPRSADQTPPDRSPWYYYAIMTLPVRHREILLMDAGWEPRFNTWLAEQHPGEAIDDVLKAKFLKVNRFTVSRRRGRARKALRDKLSAMKRKGELIRAAFDALMSEPKERHFPLPTAFWAGDLVALADGLNYTTPTDLARTAAELDHSGYAQRAVDLANALESRASGAGTRPESTWALWIQTAMYLDHRARECEREKDYQRALTLVRRGLTLLERVVSAKPGLDGRNPDIEIQWWSQYQSGVLKRRVYELRLALEPDKAADADLLADARDIFRSLWIRSDRMDHRISLAHQDAVCDLLSNDLDQAENGFRRCLAARDEYDITEPGREHIEETRHRRAYEHRRLGQVYAKRAAAAQTPGERDTYYMKSIGCFKEAVSISADCDFRRYLLEILHDAHSLLPEDVSSQIGSYIGQQPQ